MKIQVRRGVFETNSSSTHSLSIFKQSDWNRFENGEMVMENYPYDPKLVERSSVLEKEIFDGQEDEGEYWEEEYKYITYNSYCHIGCFEQLYENVDDYIAVSIYGEEY